MSTKSFRALGASEHVCAALAQRGISEPFPIQDVTSGERVGQDELLDGEGFRDATLRKRSADVLGRA